MSHTGKATEPPTGRSPEVERHMQLNVEHGKLRHDVDVVRGYGEAHPDAWVGLRFENEPSVRIVALFVGDDLRPHEGALRELVEHPDQLELRPSRYLLTRLEEIRVDIHALATSGESGRFKQWGIGQGTVNVQLRASEEPLAAELHERYGRAVDLTVGLYPYPDLPPFHSLLEPPGAPTPLLPPDLAAVSVPSGLTIRSGEDLISVLLTHNHTDDELVVETNGQVTARVMDPETGRCVGGFTGAQHVPLIRFRVAPHTGVDVPMLIGTASFVPELGYAVPPGMWSIEVNLRITDHGRFRTPLLPISIIQ
jgi:hypothetical protein